MDDGWRCIKQPSLKMIHPEFEAIIPHEFLSHLQKLLLEEGSLQFAFHEGQLFVQFDSLVFSSAILDGKFPNYTMFIPTEHQNKLITQTSELMKAIGFVATLVDEDTHKMIWNMEKNSLTIYVKNIDHGETEEVLSMEYTGNPHVIGLNYKLISEILRQIEMTDVEFHFNDAQSPILVKEKGRDEYTFIIMPMKVEDA